jgi:hypothetical protein
MSKIINLNESDILKIVNRVINEQWVYQKNNKGGYTLANGPYQGIEAKTLFPSYSDSQYPKELDKNRNPVMKDGGPVPTMLTSKYQQISCIPYLFRHAYYTLKKQGYNITLLKASLGIIGRESSFGTSDRFQYLNPLKTLASKVGFSTSVGYGQIKPETAKELGIPEEDLNTTIGSLNAVYQIISKNYAKATQTGYSADKPSMNLSTGTGNAALDVSIAAFNLGASYITNWCETTDNNVKGRCSQDKTKNGLQIFKDKPVKNYLPNLKSERWDGVNISTHGYVSEVAKNINSFKCG